LPEGFVPLFLPAEILPASLLTPPVPLPVMPLALIPPVVDPPVDEPTVPPLEEDPPAAELPAPPLWANANGPATKSAAAKIIVAGFIVSFPSCFNRGIRPANRRRSSGSITSLEASYSKSSRVVLIHWKLLKLGNAPSPPKIQARRFA